LAVIPITNLQSPDDSVVDFNVYVKSDNIVFNEVTDEHLPLEMTEDVAQGSERVIIRTESLDDSSSHVPNTCYELNPTGAQLDHICEDHFGEMPVSFRSLLNRFFTTSSSSPTGVVLGIQYVSWLGVAIPRPAPSVYVSSTETTLLSYLRYAYMAMRGGVKKRVRCIGLKSNMMDRTTVSLTAPSLSPVSPPISSYVTGFPRVHLDGSVMFVQATNGGIEFEIPFYTNNLFANSCQLLPFDDSDTTMNGVALQNYKMDFDFREATANLQIVEDTAASEDFSLVRFVAAPFYSIA